MWNCASHCANSFTFNYDFNYLKHKTSMMCTSCCIVLSMSMRLELTFCRGDKPDERNSVIHMDCRLIVNVHSIQS